MVNLYVMQDRVSGAFGSIFQSTNDDTVKRDFINIACNPAIPDYCVDDTVVIHLGTFDQDERNPLICSIGVPRVVLRGDDIEIREARKRAIPASPCDSV